MKRGEIHFKMIVTVVVFLALHLSLHSQKPGKQKKYSSKRKTTERNRLFSTPGSANGLYTTIALNYVSKDNVIVAVLKNTKKQCLEFKR